MSATETALPSRKLISLDRKLLVAASAILLSHAGLYYVCLHYNLFLMAAFNWWTASLILGLHLPENIESAIIDNLFMFVVGESFAVILTIRFIQLGTLKSIPLLSCAVLLIAYHFGGSDAVDYAFDEIRLQANRPAYLAMARSGESRPYGAIFPWGGTGFLDTSIQYYLVLDRTGALARGELKPEDFGWRAEHMKCDGSVRRLSSEFYSITVWCVGT